eukprot:12403259-Karenia_brevis.AAC.1
MLSAAVEVFGRPSNKPVKPWHASDCYSRHRQDGHLVFQVLGIPRHLASTVLHAVDQYVHLGSIIAQSGSLKPDA